MKIATLGSGGREHAIAWKLSQVKDGREVFLFPGNPGFANSKNIDISNFSYLRKFCLENEISLLVPGSESILADGIVESFRDSGISVFGPDKQASRLESSKIWAKNFMSRYGVATAPFHSFHSVDDARNCVMDMDGSLVVKYDGLAAGKGVFLCSSIEESMASLDYLRKRYGENVPFLIEEKLFGEEVSLIAFTDGKSVKLLSPSQDHKRAFDEDEGPNTGGMGAYCPVPFWTEELENRVMKEIISPTLKGIRSENFDYKGVIYFGIIVTEEGPKLLEYNVRFGDPEAQVILPALKTDLLTLIQGCLEGDLQNRDLEFHSGVFLDVVLASGGYPGKYDLGYEISGMETIHPETLLFHSGTALENGKVVTNGGRVLNLVSWGENLWEASNKVYKECEKICFAKSFYRKDIGRRALPV